MRGNPFGEPLKFERAFTLHKQRCGRSLEAICRLLDHQLGWELRLEINGDLQRSEICRSTDEVLALARQWESSMIEQGWQ